MIVLGVDISNYSAVPMPDQLDEWYVMAGVRFVIVGCQRDQTAHAQLQALTADGRFHLEAYQWYKWDGSHGDRTKRALKLMADHGLDRLWIDVEEPRGQATTQYTNGVVTEITLQVYSAGKARGMYTGAWCWPDIMGDTTAFNLFDLWHAAYPANGQPPDFDTFKPYGGWRRPTIWQYKGSTLLADVNVDLNAWEDPNWMNGGDDLSAEERKELEDARTTLALVGARDKVTWSLSPGGSYLAKPGPTRTQVEWVTRGGVSFSPPIYIPVD